MLLSCAALLMPLGWPAGVTPSRRKSALDTGCAVVLGNLFGGGLMVGAAVVAAFLAVPAERRALEDVAPPLSSVRV